MKSATLISTATITWLALLLIATLNGNQLVSASWSQCGLLKSNREFIGGEETMLNEFPWVVWLHIDFPSTQRRQYCMASLISNQWLLTAAHCCLQGNVYPKRILAHFGKHDLSTLGENSEVKMWVNIPCLIHPDYQPSGEDTLAKFDFALLELAAPVSLNNRVSPVCLPDALCHGMFFAPVIQRDECRRIVASAWDKDPDNNPRVNVLRKGVLKVTTHLDCRTLRNYSYPDKLCATGRNGLNACLRYSGGPIMCEKNNQLHLMGFSLNEDMFCTGSRPYVHSHICPVLPWIKRNIKLTGSLNPESPRYLPPKDSMPDYSQPDNAQYPEYDECECGMACSNGPARVIPKISLGSHAMVYEFPWMAYLQVFVRTNNESTITVGHCGGSLISDQWVLTAAHCLITAKGVPEKIIVHLGKHDLSSGYASREIVVDTDMYAVHPHFNFSSYNFDIALVKLPHPVTFTRQINRVCLPDKLCRMMTDRESDSIDSCTQVTSAGWGSSQESPHPSHILQKVELNLLSHDDCERQIGGTTISDAQFCAKAKSRGADTCSGDSGGPVMCKTDDRYYSIGVTSMGEPSCSGSIPSVYSRVCRALPWIKNKLHRGSSLLSPPKAEYGSRTTTTVDPSTLLGQIDDPQEALGRAAAFGDMMQVEYLLQYGIPADFKSYVHWCRIENKLQMIEGTPLVLAAACNASTHVILLLLRHHANINARDKISGRTPLILAAQNDNIATTGVLLTNGASVNATDNFGFTALMRVADCYFCRNSERIGRFLLDRDVSIIGFASYEDGFTALMMAANNDKTSLVHLLLDKGATA